MHQGFNKAGGAGLPLDRRRGVTSSNDSGAKMWAWLFRLVIVGIIFAAASMVWLYDSERRRRNRHKHALHEAHKMEEANKNNNAAAGGEGAQRKEEEEDATSPQLHQHHHLDETDDWDFDDAELEAEEAMEGSSEDGHMDSRSDEDSSEEEDFSLEDDEIDDIAFEDDVDEQGEQHMHAEQHHHEEKEHEHQEGGGHGGHFVQGERRNLQEIELYKEVLEEKEEEEDVSTSIKSRGSVLKRFKDGSMTVDDIVRDLGLYVPALQQDFYPIKKTENGNHQENKHEDGESSQRKLLLFQGWKKRSQKLDETIANYRNELFLLPKFLKKNQKPGDTTKKGSQRKGSAQRQKKQTLKRLQKKYPGLVNL